MVRGRMKKAGRKIKNIFNAVTLQESEIKGHFDVIDGQYVHGWAIDRDKKKPVTLSLYINNVKYKNFSSGAYREDLALAEINEGFAGFSEKLNLQEIVQNYGHDCTISIRSELGHYELKNSPKKLNTPDVAFSIDIFENGVCAGWIVDKNNQDISFSLNVIINGISHTVSANLPRTDLSVIGITNFQHGFYINAFEISEADECDVCVELNYDKQYTLAPLTKFSSFSSKVKSLTELQSFLRKEGYASLSKSTYQVVHSIIPALIDQCRANSDVPMISSNHTHTDRKSNAIAVIVPVYKGVQETVNCINSVISAENNVPYRLIVINDCSPDEDMEQELSCFQNFKNVEIYKNDVNLGFVGTVNRGMIIAEEHDVILLNSDTIVADGWLDAIITEAYNMDDSKIVGTVTPISNNATICSFPEFCIDNSIPYNYDVSKLAAICSTNTAPAQELPTAHGYCMFIKREVLNDVGYFDHQKWGKGYAEENDFSLRASKLGWKHVVTNKTFVHHLGSVSFASSASEFIAKNLEKLNGIYPDYPELVAKFVKNDPVRVLRQELAEKIIKIELARYSKKPVLFISLVIGGGTKVATDEMEKLLNKEDYPVIMLTCRENGMWRLSLEQVGVFSDYFIENEKDLFIDFLKEIGVWHVHYHHTLQFPTDVWSIPGSLGCKYDVTLHDYYTVCPRANMVSHHDKFCGNPTTDDCNRCIRQLGVHSSSKLKLEDIGNNVQDWRGFHSMHLSKARKVYTPSNDTMQRIKGFIPLKNIEYKYHPEPLIFSTVNHRANAEINIGFIGAIGPHKGVEIIKGLARYIQENGEKAKITVIGYTSDDSYFEQFDFVKITGKYDRERIDTLLKENEVDIIFLSSIWPETFSYTFTEAVASDLPIATFKLGAVMERSDSMRSVLQIPLNDDYASIFNTLKTHLSTLVAEQRSTGVQYPSIIKNYYNIKVQ